MKKYLTTLFVSMSVLGACKDSCEPGPVKEDCVCAYILDPVCGCDGETYSNACFADCQGVTSSTEGSCKD